MESCVRLLPDYAEIPNKGMALEKAGIKKFKLFRKDFSGKRTFTLQSAYVDLLNENGIHMSRLTTLLRSYKDKKITIDSKMVRKMLKSHENASSAYWECAWESEHIMENEQELYVKCSLEAAMTAVKEDWYFNVEVPYASVCPCAAAMCREDDAGVPHMQRAMTRVTCRVYPNSDLDELQTTIVARIVDIVDLVPIPVMKRDKELEWCQRAEMTNLFVEDAGRLIGAAIDSLVEDWVIVCTHFESIHDHDVVSICRKGDQLV